VLVAIGLLLAGWATLREGYWVDWRRFTPIAAGASAIALIPLQLTPALPSAVAAYGLSFVAIGVALRGTPQSSTARPRTRAQRA
jgi:hypothetical protein